MSPKPPMTTFTLRGASADATLSPQGVAARDRRRGITVTLGPHSYVYRVTGALARQLLEREDGTAVAMLRGLRGDDKIAESADAVDLAVALVMFFGVPISAITAQA